MPISIVHIEDDPLWGAAVSVAMAQWPDFTLVGSAATGTAGVEKCRALAPQIVVLDLRLPDVGGLTVLDLIRTGPHPPKVLFLTCRADDVTMFQVSSGAVNSIIWKSADFRLHLFRALSAIGTGGRYFSPEAQAAVRRFTSHADSFHKILSPREQHLLPLFAEGHSDEEMAALVGATRSTMHSHRRNIMAKLGLHRTEELMTWAQQKGFFSPLLPSPPCGSC